MATVKLSSFILLVVYNCTSCSSVYTNTWAIKILCYEPCVMLEGLAHKHGFENLSQVVSNYYTFDHKLVPTRSKYPNKDISTGLLAEAEVLWAEQQVLQNYKLYSSHGEVIFNDPKWKDQWYMMRDNGPTYNVLDVWKMGYTGRGVVVGVVDDGLENDHPELEDNYDPDASFDFVENDDDPSPRDPSYRPSHGIRCAGIISAVANNSFCGVGIAYSAKIGGIRILSRKGVTDALKAKGLGFKQNYVDIYSSSWGPKYDGFEVGEAGVLTEEVLREGAFKGRQGRGSIFVFAAGNGGYVDNSCAFNGLVNSIYTIAITGVNKDGSLPKYGERCPGILAVTYSKEEFLFQDEKTKVITAAGNGQCTEHFGASSAAAAMASGLIALAVEANKNLSWRDMQHIIIRSSRAGERIIKAKDWNGNGANLAASSYAGFGLMDAYGLVSLALNWTTVAPQLNCTIPYLHIDRVIPSANVLQVTTSLKDVTNSCPEINFLEHVQVRLNLNYTIRGDLEINLTSPQGMTSRLTQRRPRDNSPKATNLTNWTILTLHHWGENPSGIWKLSLKNSRLDQKNTATDPLKGNPHVPNPKPLTVPITSPPQDTTPTARQESDSDDLKISVPVGYTSAVVVPVVVVVVYCYFRRKSPKLRPSADASQSGHETTPASVVVVHCWGFCQGGQKPGPSDASQSGHKTTPESQSGHGMIQASQSGHGTTSASQSGHKTTPTSQSEHKTTPVSPSEHEATPVSPSEHGMTPVSPSEQEATPVSATEHGTTPVSPEHEATPVSQSERKTTPVSLSEHGMTPASPSEHGMTPASQSEHKTTPVSPSEHGTTPASPSEHGMTPASQSEHKTTPVFPSEHGTTPASPSEHGMTPASQSEHKTTLSNQYRYSSFL